MLQKLQVSKRSQGRFGCLDGGASAQGLQEFPERVVIALRLTLITPEMRLEARVQVAEGVRLVPSSGEDINARRASQGEFGRAKVGVVQADAETIAQMLS